MALRPWARYRNGCDAEGAGGGRQADSSRSPWCSIYERRWAFCWTPEQALIWHRGDPATQAVWARRCAILRSTTSALMVPTSRPDLLCPDCVAVGSLEGVYLIPVDHAARHRGRAAFAGADCAAERRADRNNAADGCRLRMRGGGRRPSSNSKCQILGVIENMSDRLSGKRLQPWTILSGEIGGGGATAARELDADLLGDIALDAEISASGDLGRPIVVASPESAAARTFGALAQKVVVQLRALSGARSAPWFNRLSCSRQFAVEDRWMKFLVFGF